MILSKYKKIIKRLFFLIRKTNLVTSLEFLFFPEKILPYDFEKGKNYSKFILLCHPRSGSSLIKSTIQKHPDCVFFGEIFHTSRIRIKIPPKFEHFEGLLVILRNMRPIQFLNRYIFQGYSNSINAVGFKLFPEQVTSNKVYQLYDWLESNADVKVILLYRKNLLKYLTSLEIAKKRKKFYINKPTDRSIATISLSKEYCEKRFSRRDEYLRTVRDKIKNHQCLELQYEDLLEDSNESIKEIQQFIGLEVKELEVTLLRQEFRTLPEIITNYSELKEQFSGSKWAHFFED